MRSVPCARTSCGNRTTDPSGRCHWHHTTIGAKRYPVPGSPGLTAVPRFHPTGGYDDVLREQDRTTYTRGGLKHREDGPAFIHRSRNEYYRHGKKHRLDGPAIESPRKSQWWVEGALHRLDGPAWTERDGTEKFFVHGEEFAVEEFVRLREALDDGAPHEWARSYAKASEG